MAYATWWMCKKHLLNEWMFRLLSIVSYATHTGNAVRDRCASFEPQTTLKKLYTKFVKYLSIFNMCVLVYLIYAVYCIKSQNWSFKKGEKVFKTWNVCFSICQRINWCRGPVTLTAEEPGRALWR